MIHDHGPQDYTQEFRRQAVDLYRSTPGTTLRGIAADLGISRHTLQVWVHALDPKGPSSQSGRTQGRRLQRAGTPEAELGALRARVAALETENAELMVEQTELATERDILRQAAKISPGRRTGEPFPVRR